MCNPQTGTCAYALEPNGTTCNDGELCTVDDSCIEGVCGGDDPCPGQFCNPSNGACVECLTAGDCPDDGNPCTNAATCVSGACQVTNNTNPCDDGLFCTVSDHCVAGTCVSGGDQCTTAPNLMCNENTNVCVECLANADCNDTNACTNDSCVSGQCLQVANSNPCDDGLFCTVNDTCSNGTCDGAENCTIAPNLVCSETTNTCVECLTVENCADDGNECTDTVCVSGACQDVNNTAPCNDGDICTTDDSCLNGVCGGNEACPTQFCNPSNGACVECLTAAICSDDADVCTDKACVSGVCQQVNNTASCDDGFFCTINDSCLGGVCGGDDACLPTETCDEDLNECIPNQ